MRQSIKAAGLASLLLLSLTDLSAEPLVKGFFVEKLPANSLSQALAPGKGLVLAHVLNQSTEAIPTGSYQVGVQIEDKGSVKTYSLSPKDSITPGALKTFRMAVPIDGVDKNTGVFRVFSRVNGITTWSDKYSFLQGIHSSKDKNGITTLYTEAPVANEDRIVPKKEVPFETESSSVEKAKVEKTTDINKMEIAVDKAAKTANSKVEKDVKAVENKVKTETAKAQKTAETKKEAVTVAAKSAVTEKTKPVADAVKDVKEKKENKTAKVEEKVEKAKEKTTVAAAETKASVNRKINPSEFKKLRTMDEELIIYVVKSGDTLKSISENYYGTASKERVIADLNFIEKSSAVRVGEEIIVEVRPLSKS